jgi:hypothetical protein
MESIWKIRKEKIFKNISSSYIDVTLMIRFHCDVSGLIDCPICNRKSYEYIASVDNIKIDKINPRSSFSQLDKNNILGLIEVRVEQILDRLPSCFLNREIDDLHQGYIENIFYGYYILQNIFIKTNKENYL